LRAFASDMTTGGTAPSLTGEQQSAVIFGTANAVIGGALFRRGPLVPTGTPSPAQAGRPRHKPGRAPLARRDPTVPGR
jgi:hypothetical protein